MSKQNNLTDLLKSVADAIRIKKGTTELINPQNFDEEILTIDGGSSIDFKFKAVYSLPQDADTNFIYLIFDVEDHIPQELPDIKSINNLNICGRMDFSEGNYYPNNTLNLFTEVLGFDNSYFDFSLSCGNLHINTEISKYLCAPNIKNNQLICRVAIYDGFNWQIIEYVKIPTAFKDNLSLKNYLSINSIENINEKLGIDDIVSFNYNSGVEIKEEKSIKNYFGNQLFNIDFYSLIGAEDMIEIKKGDIIIN